MKLYTPDGKIAVDNTLNARLQVVLAQVSKAASSTSLPCTLKKCSWLSPER